MSWVCAPVSCDSCTGHRSLSCNLTTMMDLRKVYFSHQLFTLLGPNGFEASYVSRIGKSTTICSAVHLKLGLNLYSCKWVGFKY